MRTQAPENDENLGPDKRRVCTYLSFLIRTLSDPYSEYYSDGNLNSEGMTLLMNLVRQVVQLFPELRESLRKCVREREYTHVMKCLSLVQQRVRSVCGDIEDTESSKTLLTVHRLASWDYTGT